MAFSWGAALTDVGKSIPAIGKTYDDMLREKKQSVLDKIALDDVISNMNMKGEARKKYGEYQAELQGNKEYIDKANSFVGPPTFDDKKKYEILSKVTPDQLQEKYNLPFLSAYEPGVKAGIESDSKKGGPGGLFAGWTERNRQKDDILKNINPYGLNAGKPFETEDEAKAANKEWRERWNTSGELAISPEYVAGAANKAAEVQKAIIPGKVTEVDLTTRAKGNAEAQTADFETQRVKEWDKTLGDYNEAYQQYSLGRSAKDDATGDVALVNALEKVREINSAVMYGDYQKWQQASNAWSTLANDGFVDAVSKTLTKRLDPTSRQSIKELLNGLFLNRQAIINSTVNAKKAIAKKDFGWDDSKIERVYRAPTLGFDSGFQPERQDSSATKKKMFNPNTNRWE